MKSGCAPQPSPYPPGLSWCTFLRGFKRRFLAYTVPSSLDRPGPSGSTGPPCRCQGCSRPPARLRRASCPQLLPLRCDTAATEVSHLRSVTRRLVAHAGEPAVPVPLPDRSAQVEGDG